MKSKEFFLYHTSDLPNTSVMVHLDRKSVAKPIFSSCISFEVLLSRSYLVIYRDSEFSSNKFSRTFVLHISRLIFGEIGNIHKPRGRWDAEDKGCNLLDSFSLEQSGYLTKGNDSVFQGTLASSSPELQSAGPSRASSITTATGPSRTKAQQ